MPDLAPNGRYTIGFVSSSSELYLLSPTTPTTWYGGDVVSPTGVRNMRPSALSVPKNRRAIVRVTIATLIGDVPSTAVNVRPARSGMPIVEKKFSFTSLK